MIVNALHNLDLRDLQRRIAAHLGWKDLEWREGGWSEGCFSPAGWFGHSPQGDRYIPPETWVADLNTAFTLVANVREVNLMTGYSSKSEFGWIAMLSDPLFHVVEWANTPALAVCRAWLAYQDAHRA